MENRELSKKTAVCEPKPGVCVTPDITPDLTDVHNTLMFVAILSQQDKICQLAALQYKADNEMESPPTLLVCCGIGIVHHMYIVLN